jgi:hypothetical protein
MPLAKLLTGLVAALAAGVVIAADSPDDVLIQTAETQVTRADYDSALARIPPDLRDAFATSPQRLTALLNNIVLTKTLAARARQAGLAPEAGASTDTPADLERALAAAETRAIEDEAKRDFDSRQQALTATARETSLLDKRKYQRPEEVKISAILISTDARGTEAALALAQSTRAKLLAWADFAALAKEMSDDKASAPNGGQLPWAEAKQMDQFLRTDPHGRPARRRDDTLRRGQGFDHGDAAQRLRQCPARGGLRRDPQQPGDEGEPGRGGRAGCPRRRQHLQSHGARGHRSARSRQVKFRRPRFPKV